jgi:hypothetical protein
MISAGLMFPFSYMNIQYFHRIHPPAPFLISPPPTVNPQTGPSLPSCSPFLFA